MIHAWLIGVIKKVLQIKTRLQPPDTELKIWGSHLDLSVCIRRLKKKKIEDIHTLQIRESVFTHFLLRQTRSFKQANEGNVVRSICLDIFRTIYPFCVQICTNLSSECRLLPPLLPVHFFLWAQINSRLRLGTGKKPNPFCVFVRRGILLRSQRHTLNRFR